MLNLATPCNGLALIEAESPFGDGATAFAVVVLDAEGNPAHAGIFLAPDGGKLTIALGGGGMNAAYAEFNHRPDSDGGEVKVTYING